MKSAGVLTRHYRAAIFGAACAIALVSAAIGASVSSAADASAAAWAGAAASPAAPVAADPPIAEVPAPAAAITPAADASSAAAGVSSYVADRSATRELAPPASLSTALSPLDEDAAAPPSPDPDDTPIGTIPPNLLKTLPEADAAPPSTVEIAPAVTPPQAPQEAPAPAAVEEQDSPSFVANPEIRDYEQHQADMPAPGMIGAGSMQSYLSEDAISSPIGIQLREARRTLKSGEEADGLLVTKVVKGSPAAAAGLHAYARGIHNALTGAMIVAGLVFPPAILGVPLLDYTQVGESYDMIIGVDGTRVTDFLEFQDRMRDLKPGEIVYLSVVRDGRRVQVQVDVPAGTTLATW